MEPSLPPIYPSRHSQPISLNWKMKMIPPRPIKLWSIREKTSSKLWKIREEQSTLLVSDSTIKNTTQSTSMQRISTSTSKRYSHLYTGTRRSMCGRHQKLLHHRKLQHSAKNGQRRPSKPRRAKQTSGGTGCKLEEAGLLICPSINLPFS